MKFTCSLSLNTYDYTVKPNIHSFLILSNYNFVNAITQK